MRDLSIRPILFIGHVIHGTTPLLQSVLALFLYLSDDLLHSFTGDNCGIALATPQTRHYRMSCASREDKLVIFRLHRSITIYLKTTLVLGCCFLFNHFYVFPRHWGSFHYHVMFLLNLFFLYYFLHLIKYFAIKSFADVWVGFGCHESAWPGKRRRSGYTRASCARRPIAGGPHSVPSPSSWVNIRKYADDSFKTRQRHANTAN